MWPKIRDGLQSHIHDGETLPQLCHFFRQPYASEFLADGLIFLDRWCAGDPDQVLDRHELEEVLARFLVAVRGTPELSGNPSGKAAQAYLKLVGFLAARRSPLALQLQRELGRNVG
jgi:hypothetical protein